MNRNPPIYIADTSFLSPLGLNADENFESVLKHRSGISLIENEQFFSRPVLASVFDHHLITDYSKRFETHSRFDSVMLACATDILEKRAIDYSAADVLIILSTTKGNVELLAVNQTDERVQLTYSATLLQQKIGNPNKVLIVSNACISGVSALITARRYLHSGHYRHILVVGCDVVSRFVLSGFVSFHAISKKGCRPFDAARDGVVLGEACGAVLLSTEIPAETSLMEGAISNDANHISGPSVTGAELAFCIQESLMRSGINSGDIDFIAAHGTATNYNDEMESKAIEMAGVGKQPLFSVKAHLGHTLGASGVIETIIASECLQRNCIIPSLGFETLGVTGNVTVSNQLLKQPLHYALKTTSGFGGCNAALLLKKNV